MKNTIYNITLFIALALATTSCKDFLDVNIDPNSPVKENLSLNAKLPAALVSSARHEATTLNEIGGFWGGYWGTSNEGISSFASLKMYNGLAIRDSRDGIQVWETNYSSLLYYNEILEQATNEDGKFYAGIAKIMMAYHYFTLVDFYNNVPFDEALRGSSLLHPKYNKGQDVYEKSINLITEGIADIKVASLLPTTDDVLFKGNKDKWVRFGNTLKLRALLTQSEVSSQASFISSEIAKIKNEGSGFLTEDASVNPGYLNTTGKMNPVYEIFYRNNTGVAQANHLNIRPTKYLIDSYNQTNDPRLVQNFIAIDGEYNGVIFGENSIKDEFAAAKTSAFKGPVENGNSPAGFLKSFNQSTVLISLTETEFLRAEAIQRGWLEGNAATTYNNAIKASFNYLFNTNNYNIDSFIAKDAVNYNTATNKIERIISQKWIALMGINNIRAWNDYRRVGFPKFPNSASAINSSTYPLRFMYPESEINTNNDNVKLEGDVNILTAKVWWDVE